MKTVYSTGPLTGTTGMRILGTERKQWRAAESLSWCQWKPASSKLILSILSRFLLPIFQHAPNSSCQFIERLLPPPRAAFILAHKAVNCLLPACRGLQSSPHDAISGDLPNNSSLRTKNSASEQWGVFNKTQLGLFVRQDHRERGTALVEDYLVIIYPRAVRSWSVFNKTT